MSKQDKFYRVVVITDEDKSEVDFNTEKEGDIGFRSAKNVCTLVKAVADIFLYEIDGRQGSAKQLNRFIGHDWDDPAQVRRALANS